MASKVRLLPYQQRWLRDESRFKIGLWARQTGKSFTVSLEAVMDSMRNPRRTWVFLSRGERQSLELAEKAQTHLRFLQAAHERFSEPFEAGVTQHRIELPNGSRLIFLPANPDTARGYTASVVLDEFAFHRDSHAIWAALYPSITRYPDLKVRVVSTPNGNRGKFYELWHHGGEVWSRHRVTIWDAVQEGLPVNPQELREGLADDLAWAQEYELEFVDETTAFIPYELILAAEGDTLQDAWNQEASFLGVDIGRHRDLTVFVVLERVGDVYWVRLLKRLHRAPFAEQERELHALLPRVARACIDATGMGEMLAENARRAFGWRVEPVKFSLPVKADLAQALRLAFEDRKLRIPARDLALRNALHSVKRVVTPSGNVRYDAERSEQGHADEFWALALALHAAETRRGPVEYKSVLRRAFAGWKGAL
ncbi:terminase large subunit domain-containing protein [Thermus tengchongensis]|uniref:Terminase large subunit gp17-like C-terminal domain-containing protein n=1 Tax=Thermus tengchongensis TaxID=1214928 RepID=A0A4Y9FAG9_9DEIN|nr:terminase family protein [Thermus tengchongensis]TFU26157.1 hypothetical protein E0687_07130 [Thermus tengchongensis]